MLKTLRPTNTIGYLINHLAFVFSKQSDQVLQERLGVGFSQLKILMILRWRPHIQQREIADSLGQTEASISRQIKLLHEKGLLRTQVNPRNRREHITTLTSKGDRFTEEALRVLDEYHAPVFKSLSAKERQKLLEILTSLHQSACVSTHAGSCNRFFSSSQE